MSRRVLLVIDIQNDYFHGGKLPLPGVEAARDKAVLALGSARSSGTPVIHIRHEFPNADAPFFVADSDGSLIHASVLPHESEAVIVKHHANAFRDTDLDERLKAHAPDEVVIVGAMSHMCIDATARAAADLGHAVVVLHDACATLDLQFGEQVVPAVQVHAAFMASLASGYARLLSVEEYIAA